MNALDQLAIGWQALATTVRQLFVRALWAPWLVLGAMQLVLLAALWEFAHPAVSWLLAPWIARAAGEGALHYPGLFVQLPELYAEADLLLGATFGSLVIGAGTLLFAARFRGEVPDVGAAWRTALRRGATLVLVNLPLNLLAIGLSEGLLTFVESRGSGGIVKHLVQAVTAIGLVVLQAMFLYVNADVMLERRGAIEALLDLPRIWSRGFWAGAMVSALVLAPLAAFHWIFQRSAELVQHGPPERVGLLVVAQVATTLLSWFLLAGTATLVYMSAMGEYLEPERA